MLRDSLEAQGVRADLSGQEGEMWAFQEGAGAVRDVGEIGRALGGPLGSPKVRESARP